MIESEEIPFLDGELEGKYWHLICSVVKRYRLMLLGLVISIGSSGLILGGLTVAATGLFVALGLGLIEALTAGFAVVGMGGVLVGALLVYFGFPR